MEIYAMFFEKLNHQKVNSPKINILFYNGRMLSKVPNIMKKNRKEKKKLWRNSLI